MTRQIAKNQYEVPEADRDVDILKYFIEVEFGENIRRREYFNAGVIHFFENRLNENKKIPFKVLKAYRRLTAIVGSHDEAIGISNPKTNGDEAPINV